MRGHHLDTYGVDFILCATAAVVPEPRKESKTKSPGVRIVFEYHLQQRLRFLATLEVNATFQSAIAEVSGKIAKLATGKYLKLFSCFQFFEPLERNSRIKLSFICCCFFRATDIAVSQAVFTNAFYLIKGSQGHRHLFSQLNIIQRIHRRWL